MAFHIASIVLGTCMLLRMATNGFGKDVTKRSATSYNVEGCFNNFTNVANQTFMPSHSSSNVRCQDICRDKGYILAATKGQQCHCSNIYPKGKKVDDRQCTTKCRSYTACHSVQSCCGGPNAYSVSVVGDIDVAKQVLRRLAHQWQTKDAYRLDMMKHVTQPLEYNANWWPIYNGGWSSCRKGYLMTGLYRTENVGSSAIDLVFNLKKAKCRLEPGDEECYNLQNVFNNKGWYSCRVGYYMAAVYAIKGTWSLNHINTFQCCRPKSKPKSWGHCYNHDGWVSFNSKGWTKCRDGYFIVGLYKSACQELNCLEEFKCCTMPGYPFTGRPTISIKVKDTEGKLKECSMKAWDTTPESKTYKCKAISDLKDILTLESISFKIKDKTAPSTAKPERVKNYWPVICSSHPSAYECQKTLGVSIATSSTFTIGSGLSTSLTFGSKTTFEAGAFGVKLAQEISFQVSASASFNVQSSKTKTKTISDSTTVTVKVPANEQVMIDLLRKKTDIVYKWKGVFHLLGKYQLKWDNGDQTKQDVTTILSGPDREMYAFGTWRYPNTDVLQVVITGKYGAKNGCRHQAGSGNNCKIQ